MQEIVRLSDRLRRVFDPRTSPERLARSTDAALRALYDRHTVAQRALYRYARLPEALARGVSYFSSYLTDLLRQRGLAPGSSKASSSSSPWPRTTSWPSAAAPPTARAPAPTGVC